MGLITIFTYSLVVPATTDLIVQGAARQGYMSGTKPWQLELWFGGYLAKITGGSGGFTDTPNILLGLTGITPGTYVVEMKWSADGNTNLQAPTMVISGSYK